MAKKKLREEVVQIMVTAEQKELFDRVAANAGLSVSSWALSHLLPVLKETAAAGKR